MVSEARIAVRRSRERGFADHGWLKSYHTFSFAGYYDPQFNGFGPLRVINEDRIAAGSGFGTHGHRDMEIVSYVLEGALAHKDSMGNGSVIRPGDVQRMSAGTGVLHSEFNHQQELPTHFLQIWIEPESTGITPGYEEKHFSATEKRGRLCLVASRDGRDGSVLIHQDASIFAGLFDGAEHASFSVAERRRAYVQVARGSVEVAGERLAAGDALAVENGSASPLTCSISGGQDAEVLVFDLT